MKHEQAKHVKEQQDDENYPAHQFMILDGQPASRGNSFGKRRLVSENFRVLGNFVDSTITRSARNDNHVSENQS